MLPTIFTEKVSKRIVSCEASSKFHRTSFEKERFARCFRQFSQTKLPKGSFRARLLPNFIEQCFQNRIVHMARTMRRAIPRTENAHFATVSCNRPTESYERVHPAKSKCASGYNGVPSKISKCTFRHSGERQNV